MSKILSRQVTIVTAGVVYPIGSVNVNEAIIIKALPTNSGIVYVGNNGSDSVSSTTGFPLSAGEVAILDMVGKLSGVLVTSTVSGDKVAILGSTI